MIEEDVPSSVKRLRELTHRKCDGNIADDELLELSSLLESSAKLRTYYWEMIAIESQLQWDLGSCEGEIDSLKQTTLAGSESPTEQSQQRRLAWAIGVIAIAASLLMMFAMSFDLWTGGQPVANSNVTAHSLAEQPVVGRLTKLSSETTWALNRVSDQDSGALRRGDTIELRSGTAKLDLAGKASAILHSPAIVDVNSGDHLFLVVGEMQVENADGERGLSVDTREARITDDAKAYSVDARETTTDIVVFDGEVDVSFPNSEHAEEQPKYAKRVHAGQAVQVTNTGTVSRIVSVRNKRLHANTTAQAYHPIIAAVQDDIVRDDFYSFYEIVTGGMGEDVQAFVDRPHQWNGIRERMPSYLVGGDYVKTFNDDKIMDEVQVDLTIQRPCTLYILMDNRVQAPQWLRQSFEPMPEDIGVDEVAMQYETVDLTELGVGPGNSVDQSHSIWRRVVRKPGVVRLGTNGRLPHPNELGTDSPANMYGIVAVGLSPEI
ncbi:FecR domain-containing protein [Novipirellula maiorica]|uniref:FecR domain-containing protein n=1 Tax=Novipirellula maiorica TaxID=1265734 RepID=UPI000346A224|nr:FecR domain-containing protein [Rhodopirellula maiorica]